MNNLNNKYGLESKSLNEEMNLPKNINQTRGNKICIIDWCDHIKHMADLIADRARNTPEEDNDHHAELVDEFKTKVRKAGLMLDDAYMVGQIPERKPGCVRIKVSYTGVNFSGEVTGEKIMELPATNFIDQFRKFGEYMHEVAEENGFDDLYDTDIEEV